MIAIAKRAKEHLGRDIYMVCGGMHLLNDVGGTGQRTWLAT